MIRDYVGTGGFVLGLIRLDDGKTLPPSPEQFVLSTVRIRNRLQYSKSRNQCQSEQLMISIRLYNSNALALFVV